MTGIYQITNLINGKSYVGQSKNLKERLKAHKCISKEANVPLKRAYEKYGIENFKFEIIEYCDEKELDEREIYYIAERNPEYNLTSGGCGAPNHMVTEETKNKLREASRNWWNGLDAEAKEKIIKNNLKGPSKGHNVSKETREKLRQCNLGKKQTKETIEKRKQTFINKKMNGYVQTNEGHKKKVICLETGEIFDSVKQATEKYNLTTLVGHLKGKYKTCKGKHYKYY